MKTVTRTFAQIAAVIAIAAAATTQAEESSATDAKPVKPEVTVDYARPDASTSVQQFDKVVSSIRDQLNQHVNRFLDAVIEDDIKGRVAEDMKEK